MPLRKLQKVFSKVKDNWRKPVWWKHRFAQRIIGNVYYDHLIPNNGVYVMEEDWDNLIILDACRFDTFKKVSDFDTRLDYRISRAGSTKDFIKENFTGRTFMDTVYVTGNPFLNMYAENSFFRVYSAWKDNWDEENNTVLPEDLVGVSLKAFSENPNKKLIVHFMQPHHPFLGSTEIDGGFGELKKRAKSTEEEVSDINPWVQLWQGQYSIEAFKSAYEDNLAAVLPSVRELTEKIPGKTAVTSDHGNAFGEKAYPFPIRVFGHWPKLRMEVLTKVPWVEIEGSRRDIVAGNNTSETDGPEEIEERLRSLGYLG